MRTHGRKLDDIQYYAYLKIITGGTEAEAQAKYDEYFNQISYDGALALLCGWSGMDLSELGPDQPVECIETNAIRTFLHSFTQGDDSRMWTMKGKPLCWDNRRCRSK